MSQNSETKQSQIEQKTSEIESYIQNQTNKHTDNQQTTNEINQQNQSEQRLTPSEQYQSINIRDNNSAEKATVYDEFETDSIIDESQPLDQQIQALKHALENTHKQNIMYREKVQLLKDQIGLINETNKDLPNHANELNTMDEINEAIKSKNQEIERLKNIIRNLSKKDNEDGTMYVKSRDIAFSDELIDDGAVDDNDEIFVQESKSNKKEMTPKDNEISPVIERAIMDLIVSTGEENIEVNDMDENEKAELIVAMSEDAKGKIAEKDAQLSAYESLIAELRQQLGLLPSGESQEPTHLTPEQINENRDSIKSAIESKDKDLSSYRDAIDTVESSLGIVSRDLPASALEESSSAAECSATSSAPEDSSSRINEFIANAQKRNESKDATISNLEKAVLDLIAASGEDKVDLEGVSGQEKSEVISALSEDAKQKIADKDAEIDQLKLSYEQIKSALSKPLEPISPDTEQSSVLSNVSPKKQSQISELNNDTKEVLSHIQSILQDSIDKSKMIQSLQKLNQESSISNQTKDEQIDNLNNEKSKQAEQINQLDEKVAEQQKSIDESKSLNEKLKEEITNLKSSSQNDKQTINNLQYELQKIKDQTTDLRQTLDKAKQALVKLQNDGKSKAEEISKHKSENESKSNENNDLKQENGKLQTENNNVKQ
ncbi:hypothetical protein TVAG_021780 [Trichomonas vaginalis G3]|uniref:Uncharacterized protein n=1 Tax=Trichomonas vaginalis (strain ATCC PRA-98 / G3) TaxID=412133 RepID=A2DHF8_TRIV3|nr:hypothetical protein TVAGG3_0678530 [Trichomonas vaginalis G3]EAY20231.1 hypothetical protein TVAG_021780 [Trichomonas vaginalis G3]KAI5507726.1 hypothetical protein TVAGG3_0678530 [Trichomonas vaginalis G3]|eukprot:XP_001581217.1 hypothetical protein [Trichomonas vaginalis G3]